MAKLLEGKAAIIYGGGGIGGGVARTFAVEGARVFLASDRAAGMTGTMANVTCGLVLR